MIVQVHYKGIQVIECDCMKEAKLDGYITRIRTTAEGRKEIPGNREK